MLRHRAEDDLLCREWKPRLRHWIVVRQVACLVAEVTSGLENSTSEKDFREWKSFFNGITTRFEDTIRWTAFELIDISLGWLRSGWNFVFVLWWTLMLISIPAQAKTWILPPPMEASGRDVALVFLSGGGLDGNAYNKYFEELQKSVPCRLWIAEPFFRLGIANPLEAPEAIDRSLKELKSRGFGDHREYKVLLGGHSVGGVVASDQGRRREVDGVLLLGAYLPKSRWLSGGLVADYPHPILCLIGEYDGLSPWRRLIADMEDRRLRLLHADREETEWLRCRLPLVLPRANHSYLGDCLLKGDHTIYHDQGDIRENSIHIVSEFISLISGEAREENAIEEAWKFSLGLADSWGAAREWDRELCIKAQRLVASEYRKNVGNVHIQQSEAEKDFAILKPAIVINPQDGSPRVHVYSKTCVRDSLVEIEKFGVNYPTEVLCKMKSEESLWRNAGHTNRVENPVSCSRINSATVDQVWKLMSAQQKQVAILHRLSWKFEPDLDYRTHLGWILRSVQLFNSEGYYRVQSPRFLTPPNAGHNLSGMHYCKLISAEHVLAWWVERGLP